MIEAQEMLKALTIADFPHAKGEHRSKLHKEIYKAAYPGKKKKTLDELEGLLRGR